MERSPRTPIFGASYRPHDEGQFKARFAELYQQDFSPYEDPDGNEAGIGVGSQLLRRRLSAESRVLRQHPDLRAVIRDAFVLGDDESLITAAELTQVAFLESMERTGSVRPFNVVLSYLCLANNISDIASDASGRSVDYGAVNHIAHRVAVALTQTIPDALVDDYRASSAYLTTRVNPVFRDQHAKRDFMHAKITSLSTLLFGRDAAYRYAQAIPHERDIEPISPEQIVRDSQEIGDLFTRIREAQYYGPKLAYQNHRLGGSLVFSSTDFDTTTTRANFHVHPLTTRIPSVATVVHSRRTSFKSLKPHVVQEQGTITHDYTSLEPVAIMHIGRDGELFSDMYGAVSVRDIFVRQGKYREYRTLQAEILAAYFDMTQPAEIVLSLRSEYTDSIQASSIDATEKPIDVVRRLLIPRIRYVTKLGNETEPNMATNDAAELEEKHDSKAVRYHGVTWHRRILPQGWHASPEAQEIARESGITLREGETFVRAHYRGSKTLGSVVGHQLVTVD